MQSVHNALSGHAKTGLRLLTIPTTLFDLATAIHVAYEADDEQTPTEVLQRLLNSRRVTFMNGDKKWRVICDDAELPDVGV